MVRFMKVLIIAPHPDDEVLGCGGTIAKHSENGDEIHLIIATRIHPRLVRRIFRK